MNIPFYLKFRQIQLENSSYTDRASVIHTGIGDSARRCARVHDRAITDIDADMTAVAYDTTRLRGWKTYLIAAASKCTRGMRKSDSKCGVHAHDKTGAVRTIC